jgi:protein-S-isoprenylcysteine O-methyltransferase Ste14
LPTERGPGVRFPPPLLFVAGFGVGLLSHREIPLPIAGMEPGGGYAIRYALGWVLVTAGALLALAAIAAFRRARTNILPNRPASALVVSGPYRFTRNPMYLGLTLLYLGGMFLANTWWPALLLPLVLAALYLAVIRREERYLAAEFGDAYAAYRARVRRWL